MRMMVLAVAAALLAPALPVAAQDVVGSDTIKQQLKGKMGSVQTTLTRGVKHPQAAAAADDRPAVSLPVLFETGSADLSEAGRGQLDQLGAALQDPSLAGARLRIEGHTDTVGSDASNRALSQRRADAVVAYLASKYRIERSRLVAVGMGKAGLAVKTPDQTDEPRNRRVVVINLNG